MSESGSGIVSRSRCHLQKSWMTGDSTPLKITSSQPPATYETSGPPTPITLDPENENPGNLSALSK
ncbi:hypothetical protein FOCG_08000 [Fusarium oxysporum f. sp. radicis-lycopersici 26381]|uniref:Uncharacterized protein n=1 Tax=Fusarium oxysporum Fo47 TaxID=660027 RepID=W9JK32_FUSOX|nr:hypothetical protein FOZG_15291 [Fusarium oxysporum Fo47]EWZ84946.1 hypothetical protein FOWG_11451 [Fusarium oxysporum f. sp. lycopersici MN25]EXL52178.1 hypothetical protein FOCG_08000 [Fusarium oxysporum f. sp. radicis-lycopersici 26381]